MVAKAYGPVAPSSMTLRSAEGPKKGHFGCGMRIRAGQGSARGESAYRLARTRLAPDPGILDAEQSLNTQMDSPWLLLIYTVPAEPTRKRAYVWREVKKLGAVYLRDGVCILPERPETVIAARTIAAKVQEFDGQAMVVTGARLDAARAEAVVTQFKSARSSEYAEISREAERLLQHVARETEHREFTFAELEELEEDLTKLKRWMDQVQARDYFPDGSHRQAERLLERCDEALAEFLEQAAAGEVAT